MEYAYANDFEVRLRALTDHAKDQGLGCPGLNMGGISFGWLAVWVLSPDWLSRKTEVCEDVRLLDECLMKAATDTPLYKSAATARPFFTSVFASPQKVARLTSTALDIISDNVLLAVARQSCGGHSGNTRPSRFAARPL